MLSISMQKLISINNKSKLQMPEQQAVAKYKRAVLIQAGKSLLGQNKAQALHKSDWLGLNSKHIHKVVMLPGPQHLKSKCCQCGRCGC